MLVKCSSRKKYTTKVNIATKSKVKIANIKQNVDKA